MALKIRDLKPGMSNVNVKIEVLEVSEQKEIMTGRGVTHKILESEVKDETGSIMLVLWNDRIIPLTAGDTLEIENGFVSSFKGKRRVNVGKYGTIKKI
ncbi:MAG: DNA-binding protein [Thermoproteota archaeon]|nr:DNA-binding protein [Thermoproteota archaeon]